MASNEAILGIFSESWALGLRGGPDQSSKVAAGAALRVWRRKLEDVTDNELARAFDAHLDDPKIGHMFPHPSKLRARVPQHAVVVINDWAEAWGEVIEYVQRGPWRPENALPWYTDENDNFVQRKNTPPWRDGSPRGDAIDSGVRSCGGFQAIADIGDKFRSTDTLAAVRAAFRPGYEAVRAKQGHGQTLTAISDKGQRDYYRLEVLAKKIGKASD